MLKKVSSYVKKYQMLSAGDTVVAGVSGGADSVCLLLLLSALRKEIPLQLLVVHVNHKIRKEAGGDADFVKNLCEELEVPFFLIEEDVQALAETEGLSSEEAGRQVRYTAFVNILRENAPEAIASGQAKIAVAHNLNDRAETMLFHLFRGSGLQGLASIRPVKCREDKITVIRPLLETKRSEIEAYLTKKGINWCIDSTNGEDTYTRNRIRHHILPPAEKEVSPAAMTNMVRAADILAETEDFVKEETKKVYRECATELFCTSEGRSGEEVQKVTGVVFSIQKVAVLHSFMQKQMLLYGLEKLTPARKDITAVHVEDTQSLFQKEGNRSIHLPYGLVARREYDKVVVEKRKESSKISAVQVILPKPGKEGVTVWLSDTQSMDFLVFPYEKSMNIPQNQYTKWFDYGKMGGSKSLEVRTRKAGDYLTFNAALSKKTVQDYMVGEKIPKQIRDEIPLLADQNRIVWVVGYRIGSAYKVDADTRYVLQVRYRGEK